MADRETGCRRRRGSTSDKVSQPSRLHGPYRWSTAPAGGKALGGEGRGGGKNGGVGAITSPSIIEFVDAPIEGASFARRRLDLGAIIIENLHFACHPCR